MAAVSAASGRDAVAFAPSFPTASVGQAEPAHALRTSDKAVSEVAAELGELARVLVSCLKDAAARSVHPGDREACRDGARHAAAISALLTGTAQP